MYKNYFILNRLVTELNQLTDGAMLKEVYTQERDKLNLSFYRNQQEFTLIISASQNDPYIHFRKEFRRAKKNSIDFFTEYLPAALTGVEIASDDRIIRFNFTEFSLYFIIRGKDTNVFLKDEHGNINGFKKISEDVEKQYVKDISAKDFSPYLHKPDTDLLTGTYEDTLKNIRKLFPFISKEIMSEAVSRADEVINNTQELSARLDEVIDEIHTAPLSVFYDDNLNRTVLAPATFKIFQQTDPEIFTDVISAFNAFLIKKFRFEKLITLKKTISRNLEQRLSRLSVKLNEVKGKVETPSRDELFKHYGNVLLANIHLLKKGMKEVIADDYISGEPIKITLDETMDAKGNVDRYFDKAKNERQGAKFLSGLYRSLTEEFNKLQSVKNRFEQAKTIDEYQTIMSELNINENQGQNRHAGENFNFKHYLIEDKYHVYVGRDSKNNDLLTTKFARQNDFWFHARGVPGSHVVLRVENLKEAVPKSILKKAASIAAYHSKAKTSKLAPVSYTFKKFVTKRKGMEPGKVAMMKEEVLLVPPEIPDGCMFLNE